MGKEFSMFGGIKICLKNYTATKILLFEKY